LFQWGRISAQAGIEGFYFAVRQDVEHYHEPKIFTTEAGEKYLKEIFGMTPKEISLKFEAFVIGGLRELPLVQKNPQPTTNGSRADKARSTRGRPRPKVVSECRTLIQGGLGIYIFGT
jgi:hypothetical protein